MTFAHGRSAPTYRRKDVVIGRRVASLRSNVKTSGLAADAFTQLQHDCHQ